MFKFFRKYEKWLLVIGGTLLMVAFLIQPFLSLIMPDPTKEPIGHIGGKAVPVREQYQAQGELDLLRQITGNPLASDSLQWMLMLHEARAMGISATDSDAKNMLPKEMPVDEQIGLWAQRLDMPRTAVLNALRDLAIVGRYVTVMTGQEMLSRPLLERFVGEMYSRVRITAVPISTAAYLDRVETPTEADMAALFEQYKNSLPGEGKPYGLGYRYPDRLKVEYLELPIETLEAKATVSEADALAYYEDNREQFREPGETAEEPGRQLEYTDVRQRILNGLKARAADAQAREMIKAAQSILGADSRALPRNEQGYRDLPTDWQPVALQDVATQLQERFGVLAEYRRGGAWITRENLGEQEPQLSQSLLMDAGTPALAEDYLFSVRELKPTESPLTKQLRLQRGIVSEPVQSFMGSYYLFRVTEAEPAHEPASLDEVRQQVEDDARRVAAYKLLLADRDRLRERARNEKLEDMALELATLVVTTPPFERRAIEGGAIRVKRVEGIGRDEAFITRVFELAEQLPNPADAEAAPLSERTDAVPVDSELLLTLVRIDGYTLPSARRVDELLANQRERAAFGQWLFGDVPRNDMFDVETLKKRVGFVEAERDETADVPTRVEPPAPIIPQS